MQKKLIVSAVQQPCGDDNPQVNLEFSIAKIREAAAAKADLVVLPELHLGKYFCQTEDVNQFDLAKSIPSEETDWLSNLAKTLKIVIVSSLFEKRATGLYHNTAVVFEKDGFSTSGFMSIMKPNGEATGYSIATGGFMKYFADKNR